MKILKAGTKVTTVIGDIQAIITAVSITMDTVEYRIRWFYNGEEKIAWVYRYEIEVSRPKQTAGFNRVDTPIIEDNEITLISTS
jgi:hypothetical protein